MGLSVLVTVLIILLVIVVCIYLVDQIGLPAPINMVAKAIIALVGIIILLNQIGALSHLN